MVPKLQQVLKLMLLVKSGLTGTLHQLTSVLDIALS